MDGIDKPDRINNGPKAFTPAWYSVTARRLPLVELYNQVYIVVAMIMSYQIHNQWIGGRKFGANVLSSFAFLRSWSWILRYWLVVYATLTIIGIIGTAFYGPLMYLIPFLFGVPLVIIPMTYRNLVGGGCSLKFGICALVKGILAGVVFAGLSLFANYVIFSTIHLAQGLNLMPSIQSITPTYQIWLVSAAIGGFAARIAEVRGHTADYHYMVDALVEHSKD
ncbi:hypothetical protein EU537_05525 [Candidatus Thorarchaeota archaeon]|nr:MAG: hypothetical protein EU537_05525 [Candidatus Thorarchaeota archaeon]